MVGEVETKDVALCDTVGAVGRSDGGGGSKVGRGGHYRLRVEGLVRREFVEVCLWKPTRLICCGVASLARHPHPLRRQDYALKANSIWTRPRLDHQVPIKTFGPTASTIPG